MKVLIVTHNNNEKSGANKSLLSLIDIWTQSNVKIEVLVNKTNGNLPKLIEERGLKCLVADYSWICSPRRHNWIRDKIVYLRSAAEYAKELVLFNKFVSEHNFDEYDLIYTNTSVVDFGARLSLKLGIPHIWHFREFGEEDFRFIYLLNKKRRSELYNSAQKIIVISNALREKYKRYISADSIELISNGLEIDKYIYSNTNNYLLHTPIQVLIAGQISKNKGQDQAIKAIDLLSKSYSVTLNIAGNGDLQYLKSALNSIQSKNNVKILGQVSDMFQLRKNMDIELVCSKSEAFGRVTLEAMLHHLPVVGANAGGTAELLENAKTGMLYEWGNHEDLARKIEQLILNDNLRHEIAFKGQQYAQKFDISVTANKILNLFNMIIVQVDNSNGKI